MEEVTVWELAEGAREARRVIVPARTLLRDDVVAGGLLRILKAYK